MPSAPAPPAELPRPHTRVGVGGVLVRNGSVLVNRAVYRERFTIPSGYVEAGETLEAALRREFEEETGVDGRVGPLLLVRHKVLGPEESDVYFAFALEHLAGEPTARPPEIAEIRMVPVEQVPHASWVSSLSRLAIRLATQSPSAWPRSAWDGGEVPGVATSAYHPVLDDRPGPRPLGIRAALTGMDGRASEP
jgi:ADP-ribose pyrophosphatase YjhB (NUDIX family)